MFKRFGSLLPWLAVEIQDPTGRGSFQQGMTQGCLDVSWPTHCSDIHLFEIQICLQLIRRGRRVVVWMVDVWTRAEETICNFAVSESNRNLYVGLKSCDQQQPFATASGLEGTSSVKVSLPNASRQSLWLFNIQTPYGAQQCQEIYHCIKEPGLMKATHRVHVWREHCLQWLKSWESFEHVPAGIFLNDA